MKVFVRFILKKIRPEKVISNDLYVSDLLQTCVYYAFCLFRGALARLFGLKCRVLLLGKSVRISFKKNISIGNKVFIGDFCNLSGLSIGGLVIGDHTSISSFCRIVCSTDISSPGIGITIGRNVGIGEFSSLGGSGGLYIGDNTIIAQYFSAHPENHMFDDINKPIRFQGAKRDPIKIGSGCWIGAKVTVLAGVTIGNNCVIGAGAVVTTDIPDYTIAVGNPARVVKHLVKGTKIEQ